jgi:hypothetical protein
MDFSPYLRLLFPSPRGSGSSPQKPRGLVQNLTTWGHKLQGISMNSQDPLHVLGQGHSKPSKPPSLPCFLPCVVPCGLVPSYQPVRRTFNTEYLPLSPASVACQRSSSFQTPKPISFQRQRHGSGDQQRWHRAANASISDSRGAANNKGVPSNTSSGTLSFIDKSRCSK